MKALIPDLPDDVAELCLLRVAYDGLCVLDSVCRRWRHLVRSFDFHLQCRLAGITRPLLFFHVEIIHPFHQTHHTLFDPTSGTWRLINRPPITIFGTMRPLTIISAGRSLLVIDTPVDSPVRIFDFHTGRWRHGAPMPGKARYFLDTAWDGSSRRLFVAGGCYKTGKWLQSAKFYDMVEDKWVALPEAPAGHYCSAGAVFHAGVFRRIRENVEGGRFMMDSFDMSSRDWSEEELDVVNLEPMILGYKFAIGKDGKLFCCHGGKLRVKNHGEVGWRELVDLPSNVEECMYLTCWEGGVLVAGRVLEGLRRDHSLNVYSLRTDGDDPTPATWVAQSVPNVKKGHHLIKRILVGNLINWCFLLLYIRKFNQEFC